MRIIVESIQDFVNSEIAEHGFGWVEAQFILGYEPVLVNGVWLWKDINVDIAIGNSITSTSTGTGAYNSVSGADSATTPLSTLR
jgi:hypothetical protein